MPDFYAPDDDDRAITDHPRRRALDHWDEDDHAPEDTMSTPQRFIVTAYDSDDDDFFYYAVLADDAYEAAVAVLAISTHIRCAKARSVPDWESLTAELLTCEPRHPKILGGHA